MLKYGTKKIIAYLLALLMIISSLPLNMFGGVVMEVYAAEEAQTENTQTMSEVLQLIKDKINEAASEAEKPYLNIYISDLSLTFEQEESIKSSISADESFAWVDLIDLTNTEIGLLVYVKMKVNLHNFEVSTIKDELKIIKERINEAAHKATKEYFNIYIPDLNLTIEQKEMINYLISEDESFYWLGMMELNNRGNVLYIYVRVKDEYYDSETQTIKFDDAIKDYITFNERISDLTLQIDDNMSDIDKVLAVYQWVMRECEYDSLNYLNNSVPIVSYTYSGVINEGLAVCSGYESAIKYFLDMFGVESYAALSESLDHVWNVVNIDGEYYHLDATWDDSGNDDRNEGVFGTRYFLKSDEEIQRLGHFYWYHTVACDNSGSFEGYIFRQNIFKNNYNYYDGYWYYNVSTDNKICKSKIDGSDCSDFKSFSDNIIGSYIYKGYMYVATYKNVYKIDMSNPANEEIIYESLTDSGSVDDILEFVIKQNKIKIDIKSGVTKIIDINNLSSSINIIKDNIDIKVGESQKLDTTVWSEVSSKANFISSNTSVIDVDDDGNIIAKSAGVANVYATVDGVIDVCTITVEPALIYGDANSDGKVDVADGVVLKKHLAGYKDMDISLSACDVNADGNVDVSDAVKLMKKLAGYDEVLGAA